MYQVPYHRVSYSSSSFLVVLISLTHINFLVQKIPLINRKRFTTPERQTMGLDVDSCIERVRADASLNSLLSLLLLYFCSLFLSLSLFRARDVDNRLPSLGLDCVLLTPRVIILPPTASTDKTVRVAD